MASNYLGSIETLIASFCIHPVQLRNTSTYYHVEHGHGEYQHCGRQGESDARPRLVGDDD